MTPAVCGALALAALGVGFGLAQWLYTRRLLARLDGMLAGAVLWICSGIVAPDRKSVV